MLSCSGNGHVNGRRNGGIQDLQMTTTKSNTNKCGEEEGQEMEAYVPMLTQIPTDFNNAPLDSKVTT